MRISIFVLLALVHTQAARSDETQTRVDVNPNAYPLAAFSGKAQTVKPLKNSGESIPDKEIRDAIFAKVDGLEKHIEKFDQLDKDLLLLRAKSQSISKLQEKYSSIPAELLGKLQKVAKEKK
jgi:hypothetical protein